MSETYVKYPGYTIKVHPDIKSNKGEYGETCVKYRGYTIEAIWDDEYNRWEIDAFDDEAKEYVLSPCVKVPGSFDHALEIALNRIDNKLDIDQDRDKDILIYNSKHNYDTTII